MPEFDSPSAKWNIHPGNGTWLVCYVWDTLDDMKDFVGHKQPSWDRDYFACYLGNTWTYTNESKLKTRKLGELHFVNGEFGAGIFAHELQHFLVDWICKMGWKKSIFDKHWEDIAHLAGRLTTAFWNEYYERFE